MKKIVATVAAAAMASSFAVAPDTATARTKNCGVVKNKYGSKVQVYRTKGRLKCTKVRSVVRRAQLGGADTGVPGWTCWRIPMSSPAYERGALAGCEKGRNMISIWAKGRGPR